MTHTQGPWKILRKGHFKADHLEAINGRFIVCLDGMDLKNSSECKANAALMAASPDLLDALLIALPFVEDLETDECYKAGAVKKAVAKIRAAILKATGE